MGLKLWSEGRVLSRRQHGSSVFAGWSQPCLFCSVRYHLPNNKKQYRQPIPYIPMHRKLWTPHCGCLHCEGSRQWERRELMLISHYYVVTISTPSCAWGCRDVHGERIFEWTLLNHQKTVLKQRSCLRIHEARLPSPLPYPSWINRQLANSVFM